MVAPVILALRRQRQEDLKFEACIGYTVRSCLNKIRVCVGREKYKTARYL
jgi:hypothetical protein